MTPALPRSETYTRRCARGGWAGRSVIARKSRKHLACDRATLRYATDATRPPLLSSLLVWAPRSRPPPKGAPCCSLCSQTFANNYFFFLNFRSAQSLHFASKLTNLPYKMSICRNLLHIRFYTTFVPLSYFAHVGQNEINNNY